MKRLLVLSALSLVLASAVPVAAQPLQIIVRGGQPAVIPSPLWQGDDYVYGTPFYDNGFNFDPGAAAINALNVSFPGDSRAHPTNIALAGDLAQLPAKPLYARAPDARVREAA